MPLPAAPEHEPDPDSWFEQVPTNPTSAPRLRELAAYAGPDSFYKDSQDRAVTAPIGPPDASGYPGGSDSGAFPSRGHSSSAQMPSMSDSSVRLDAAALEHMSDDRMADGELEESQRSGDALTRTTRILAPRPAWLLLAGMCLIIGMVLGALLFGQRNTTVIDCPDRSARLDNGSGR